MTVHRLIQGLGDRPFGLALLLCLAFVLGMLSLEACGPVPQVGPTSCTGNLDCPGSQVCEAGSCQYLQFTSTRIDASIEETPQLPDQKEPIPERPQEATPCQSGSEKPCQGGCGEGIQTCQNGTWGPCQPKETTQSCYEGAANTEGVGLCSKGTQTCQNGTWGPCEKQVLPTKEACGDGKDNDCDGQIDEKEDGCSCKPGETQACGSAVGECKEGKQTCSSQSAWGPCQDAINPTKELCDGLDNNCNGQIDEDFAKKGQTCTAGKGACQTSGKFACSKDLTGILCDAIPGKATTEVCDGKDNDCDGLVDNLPPRPCYSSTQKGCVQSGTSFRCQGSCKAGTQSCQSAKWGACTGAVTPSPETCRDQQDNDCNGQTDEFCGAALVFAQVTAPGKPARLHKVTGVTTTVGKVSTGVYGIKHSNPKYDCTQIPMLLSSNSSGLQAIGYVCNGGAFQIRTGKSQTAVLGRLADIPFSAVFPTSAPGEAWGMLKDGKNDCRTVSNCNHSLAYGGAVVKRLAQGNFEIRHPNCRQQYAPYFATAYGQLGHVVISYKQQGICKVRTYAPDGESDDLGFSYWLPDPKRYAWAALDKDGKLAASNQFGLSNVQWKIGPTSRSYIDAAFPSFANPSAVLVNLLNDEKYTASASFSTSVTSGVRILPYEIKRRQIDFERLVVMFVQ